MAAASIQASSARRENTPAPSTEPPVAPTGFDFTRRDSLGVSMRDIPTMLRETVEWLATNPFPETGAPD